MVDPAPPAPEGVLAYYRDGRNRAMRNACAHGLAIVGEAQVEAARGALGRVLRWAAGQVDGPVADRPAGAAALALGEQVSQWLDDPGGEFLPPSFPSPA